jgi:AbrB family looped-hinge helix DNA binding protein
MAKNLSLDRAGRVVLPKALRDSLGLEPGDHLTVESNGDRITLRPVRLQATLMKEHGIWVYQGEASDQSIPDLIDRERDQRIREQSG